MSAKIALALALLGAALFLHALRRSARVSFEGAAFPLLVLELVAGLVCVVAAAIVSIYLVLSL